MRTTVLLAAAFAATSAFAINIVDLDMDSQVTGLNGQDVIFMQSFASDNLVIGNTDGTSTYTTVEIAGGSWWYGPWISFRHLKGADIDFSSYDTPKLTFDARIFNDEDTNTAPYTDVNMFLRLYTADDQFTSDVDAGYLGHRDFGIVFQNPNTDSVDWSGDDNAGVRYPNWVQATVDLTDASGGAGDVNSFDFSSVTYMRLFGTNWTGGGDDFMDIDNVRIDAVPEPATMLALGAGLMALAARRRNKR